MTSDIEQLRDDALRPLDQARELVRGLDDESYGLRIESLASSIGGHVRHAIDFYERFLAGLETGRVDYDERRRDTAVETRRDAAGRALEDLARRFANAPLEDVTHRLEVRLDAGDDPVWTRSSVGRELVALSSHTIHHFALIAVALRVLGRPVPAGFGVAPSTLRHWAALDRCAP